MKIFMLNELKGFVSSLLMYEKLVFFFFFWGQNKLEKKITSISMEILIT